MTRSGLARISAPALRIRRLGLETQHEPIVLMHADCSIARSEGFTARAQIELLAAGRTALATLYQVRDDIVGVHEIGVSEVVWRRLQVEEGTPVAIRHPRPLESMSAVRAKLYGHKLDQVRIAGIIRDVAGERYTDVELAAFLAAFTSQPFDLAEVIALTNAMVEVGDRLDWPGGIIADKHCVGGLPANRTTPVVVAIAAAAGLTIPKTSSRAITSPAGTADAMETMAPVDLDVHAMRTVVEKEGGCVVWGGSVSLSPADDILIRVARVLDLDSPAQLVASVLSKKLAAGSTHLILDLPVGPTAKIRTQQDADELSGLLEAVGAAAGLHIRSICTDGRQPVGKGIGPALEARDVLAVLRRDEGAPADLKERACALAGALLQLTGAAPGGSGIDRACNILATGQAEAKFMSICEAQGGFREPGRAALTHELIATQDGVVSRVDNRVLARIAKLAGAPLAKTAGVEMHVSLGQRVHKGEPLACIHAEVPGELEYALSYAAVNPRVIEVLVG